jgi:membrane protease YdiL (CAAX protease family)
VRRPLVSVLLAFAGCLLLSQVLLVVGAALAFLLSGGRLGDELFGSYHLVHLGPASADRQDALMADASAELAAWEPALVDSKDGLGLRLFVDGGRRAPYAELRELAARHGFTSDRFTVGPRFPTTLTELAEDPLSAAGLTALGWMLLPSPLAFLMVGWRGRRRHVPRPPRRPGSGHGVLLGALVGAAAFGVVVALEAALAAIGLPVTEQRVVLAMLEQGGALRWGFIAVAVLLAPIGEELFFRGYVFEVLGRARGLVLAHVVSAGLFAAVHFNLGGLPIYLLLAVILAEAYRRSGGLLVPIVAHAVMNAATVATHLRAA